MQEYIFGANILENLTTGMYQDSRVIYREYIQNACDQIDKAEIEGLLGVGEGLVDIWLDKEKRTILIEDNATGIPAAVFRSTLGNIADSDKLVGEDKGFRGIGRLCGLAYCEELVFSSTVKGEDIESVLICDASKMRTLIEENARGVKHTANQVLNAINEFQQKQVKDAESHYFRVELKKINTENTDLLDSQNVKDYLSFVAPVPYQNVFVYRDEIHNHALELDYKLDCYTIRLNGEQIFKKYSTHLKEASGKKYDDIIAVHFTDFYEEDKLIAWMWVGVSTFKKAIPHINQMRGLRLRKDNIQIGGEDALQKLFKEDRGNSYFIGEVFAVSRDLIPNSQRDYFNENPARAEFERQLKRHFSEELHKIYHSGSTLHSSYKKIDEFQKKQAEFNEKKLEGGFVDKEHRDRELQSVLSAKSIADAAQKKIDNVKAKSSGEVLRKVIKRIENQRSQPEVAAVPVEEDLEDEKIKPRVDRLAQYNRAERRLLSRVFSIVLKSFDEKTAELVISKIEDGLK